MQTEATKAIVEQMFLVLNDKEKNIITKRFSLNHKKKKTLEQIGQEYDITRERVRQIEKTAISKLRRTSSRTEFVKLFEETNSIISQNGGVIRESKLYREVQSRNENIDKYLVLLSFEINPTLEKIKKSKTYTKSWSQKDKISRKEINRINKTAETLLKKEKQIIEPQEFLTQLQSELKNTAVSKSKNTVAASLSINKNIKKIKEGYGLTSWRAVRPRSIRDKALIVLRRTGKPIHFKELAKQIKASKFDKKSVTTQAVHNELIRYDDFVLVGRGIYALKEWGYKSGTVKDVIVDILEEHGTLKKSKIVEEVLKRRHVKIGTISLNLQKYPEFKRVGRAVYSLR